MLKSFFAVHRDLEKIREEHQKIDEETQQTHGGIRQLEFDSADALEQIKIVEASIAALPDKIIVLEREEAAAKARAATVDRDIDSEQRNIHILLKKKRRLESQLENIAQREAVVQELAILTSEQRRSRELVARGLKSVNSIKQRADKVLRSIDISPNGRADSPDASSSGTAEEAEDQRDVTQDDLLAFEAQLGLNLDAGFATELESRTAELEQINSEIQGRIIQHRSNVINQLRQIEEHLRAAEAVIKDLRQAKTRLEDDYAEKARRLRVELDQKQRHQTDRDRVAGELNQKRALIEQRKGRLENLRAQVTQAFVRINSIEDEIRQRDSAIKQRREQLVSKVEKWKSTKWRLAEAEQQVFRILDELKEAQAVFLQRWSKLAAEQKEGEKSYSAATKTIEKTLVSTAEFDSLYLRLLMRAEAHITDVVQFFHGVPEPERSARIETEISRMIASSKEILTRGTDGTK